MRLLLLTLLTISTLSAGCHQGFRRNRYSACVGCDAAYVAPATTSTNAHQTRKMRRWYRQLNDTPRHRYRHASAYGMYDDVMCECGNDVMWSSDAYAGEIYSGEVYSEGEVDFGQQEPVYSPQPEHLAPQPAPPVEQEYLAPEPQKFESPKEFEDSDMTNQPQPTPAPLPKSAGEPTALMMYQLPQ